MNEVEPTSTVITKETSTVTTDDPSKISGADSAIFGVSVRGWITITLATAVCVLSFMGKPIDDFLKTITTIAITWYFAQKLASK